MRSLQGRVICTANDKTVNVEVTRLAPHPKYKRRVRKKKKFQAHDPENQFQIGDVVQHEKCKPIQMVKQQQQRGLRELKKSHLLRTCSFNNGEAAFSYKVDPFSLEEGDYVVHKKVGIGRFISIRPSIPDGDTIPIDYVYIQYADGVAKLPVKQASRFLYRYTLPNESASPRGLGRLKDTSIWEKRKIKGKVAIQKMVVDLMEVYLNRLRLKMVASRLIGSHAWEALNLSSFFHLLHRFDN